MSSKPARMGAAVFAAAVLASVPGVGCAGSGHHAATAADRALSARANEALAQAGLNADRVEARAYRGVVTLLGEAEPGDIRDAQRIVVSVPGVVRVNNLVLSGGPSTSSGFARAKRAPIVARAETAQ